MFKMLFFKEHVLLIALLALTHGSVLKETGKKYATYKRAVDPYSYPVPALSFNDKPGNSKVVVETIKSISPPEFSSAGGFAASADGNIQGTTIPAASVTFNAFEPETNTQGGASPTVSTASKGTTFGGIAKQPEVKTTGTANNTDPSSGYRYPAGGSSTEGFSSTASPAPVRTSSVEPPTTLLPGFQYTMGSSAGSTVKVTGNKAKTNGYGGYSPKVTKKPTRLDQKQSDSKPEETGFNGYHYDVGSLSFDTPTKIGGSGGQGGMMGASYMRASSPFYNFHVMLD